MTAIVTLVIADRDHLEDPPHCGQEKQAEGRLALAG